MQVNERVLLNALRSAMKSPEFRSGLASLLAECSKDLAVEPVYTGPIAQRLIPCTEATLQRITRKLQLPHRYRVFRIKRNGTQLPQRYRMYSASEIHAIRLALETTKKHPSRWDKKAEGSTQDQF